MSRKRIDMAMLRTKVRGLSHGTIFAMLDDALDLLPPARLEQLVGRYLRHEDLRPIAGGSERDSPSNLRTDVEEFAVASRRGGKLAGRGTSANGANRAQPQTTSYHGTVNTGRREPRGRGRDRAITPLIGLNLRPPVAAADRPRFAGRNSCRIGPPSRQSRAFRGQQAAVSGSAVMPSAFSRSDVTAAREQT